MVSVRVSETTRTSMYVLVSYLLVHVPRTGIVPTVIYCDTRNKHCTGGVVWWWGGPGHETNKERGETQETGTAASVSRTVCRIADTRHVVVIIYRAVVRTH